MLNAGALTFQEFATREPLPLATIHEAVLDFLRARDDVLDEWLGLVRQEISLPDDEDEFD
jgi:hypothetical protein